MTASLERLRALLAEHGGLVASLLVASDASGPDGAADGGALSHGPAEASGVPRANPPLPESPAAHAAAGPRADGHRDQYEVLVEAIYEGYLLHYGLARVVHAAEPDLRVLAGDQLYAIGLARLVSLGDTSAVAELADTITLSALAHGRAAAGTPDGVAPAAPGAQPPAAAELLDGATARQAGETIRPGRELAMAVWAAGAHAVGWGSSAAHRRAKELAFAGAPEALEAMRTSPGGAAPS